MKSPMSGSGLARRWSLGYLYTYNYKFTNQNDKNAEEKLKQQGQWQTVSQAGYSQYQ